MELHIDIRWLLDRQEELLGKDLGVQSRTPQAWLPRSPATA
ncbi:hypothetical protein [Streptomyces goshikiensis]